MAQDTKIGWCDATFNPWIGCTKVSDGCKFCYAERDFDHRYKKAEWGKHGSRTVTSEENWRKPIRWDREVPHRKSGPYRVFCASLCDVFEEWDGFVSHSTGMPMWLSNKPNGHDYQWGAGHVLDNPADGRLLKLDDVRQRLFELIDATPYITWLLLTKRPENIIKMWPKVTGYRYLPEAGSLNEHPMFHRPNVWLGTSCEDQSTANERVPELLRCRDLAAKLFLSCEPLLGSIDLRTAHRTKDKLPNWPNPTRVDWVIAGCESGPKRRAMETVWAEELAEQCMLYGLPFFMKQMEIAGAVTTDARRFPESLQCQQFPK